MTGPMVTLTPGAHPAPGAGASTEPATLMPDTGLGVPAGGCSRPIQLRGDLHQVHQATGTIVSSRSTWEMPDGVIYKACGNRRAAVCPACAETYRADTYQLVLAGLNGGKGIPDTVQL